MKLQILLGSEALKWSLDPEQGMVVMSINGYGYVGYKFLNKTLDQQLIQTIASDAQEKGEVKSIKSCAGYSGGTVVVSTIRVSLDESVFAAVVRSLHNVQRDVVALGKDDGWGACKGEIDQSPFVLLYIELKDYIDTRLVRGLVDLPDELVKRIKSSCPERVYRQGIPATLKYLEPIPVPTTPSGW